MALCDAIKANDTIDADGDGVATHVGYVLNVIDWVPSRDNEPSDAARDVTAANNMRGYYHWSLMDNFEWDLGFAPRFGLYTVDFDTYARTATEGALTMAEIAGTRALSETMGRELRVSRSRSTSG